MADVVGGAGGAVSGAAVGTAILPGIGTAVGAVLGGLLGGLSKPKAHGGALPGDLALVQSQLDRGDATGLFKRLQRLGDCSQGGGCQDHRAGVLQLAHDYGYVVPGVCTDKGGSAKSRAAAGCVAPSTMPTLAPAASSVPASAATSTAPVLDLSGPSGAPVATSAPTTDPTLLVAAAAAAWWFFTKG